MLMTLFSLVMTHPCFFLLFKWTNKEFLVNYLGRLSYFLVLEVNHTSYGQAKYVSDILDHAQILSSKPHVTPWAANSQLHNN